MLKKSTRVQRVCEACGASFSINQWRAEQGQGRFCSIPCRGAPTHPVVYVDAASALIPLCSRSNDIVAYAAIDVADVERIACYRWYLHRGYARRTERGEDGRKRTVHMHRAILANDLADSLEVDHIDRDRLNNRRANLRAVSRADNMQNKSLYRIRRSSQHRGVSYDPRWNGRWKAQVKINGKARFIGHFATEAEAHAAVVDARARLMPFSTD